MVLLRAGGTAVMRLLLLRHGKSDWAAEAGDLERPLNARGRDAIDRMGRYMRRHGYQPRRVLCSPAVRTRETLARLLPLLDAIPETDYPPGLYPSEWPSLLKTIQSAGTDTPLLIVGHNPGLEQLAWALAAPPRNGAEQRRLALLNDKFSTGTLAVFVFRVKEWSRITPGHGRLCDFVRPKDLLEEAADQ
jgi:phosphohistidine phosphatase